MLCFKFHQNRTINEEFDFWGVKGLQKLANLQEMFTWMSFSIMNNRTFVRNLFYLPRNIIFGGLS